MGKEKTKSKVREFFNTDKGKEFLVGVVDPIRSNQLSDNNSRHFKLKKKIRYLGG